MDPYKFTGTKGRKKGRTQSNKGVESRAAKDLEEHEAAKFTETKRFAQLKAKAAVYEKLGWFVLVKPICPDYVLARGEMSVAGSLTDGCMVDFHRKEGDESQDVHESSSLLMNNHAPEALGDFGERRGSLVCIHDDFGRSRWVERGR